jgi:predicted transcriptional regulator of viral defense system
MHPAGPDALIAGIARRQVGVIGREQLLRLGIGVEAIRYRVGAGRLHPVFPGAYAVGVPAASVEAIRTAALISTAPSFIGHRDAAEHYGLQDPIPGPVHVIVSHRRRLRRDGIVVHRTRHLHAEERRIAGPLRLTTPARTLVDIAGACTDRQLTRAFDESQRLGLASRMEILVACERAGSRRGTGRLAALAREPAMPVDRARNRNEAEFPRFCRDRGLPIPAVNVPLLGYEVDYLWVEQGVVGELDSGHHDSPRAREADVRRDADLRAYGYPVIRMRQRDLRSGAERLAARLRRLLLSDPA